MGVAIERLRRAAVHTLENVRGLHPRSETQWSTSAPSSLVPWLRSWWHGSWGWSPDNAEGVGSASRCLQLVSQQISTLPLRYRHQPETQGYEPAWVSNPDPVWFPNGITDAMFAIVWSIYGWGDAFLWVTGRYEGSGYPRTWTVLDPAQVTVSESAGTRLYRVGDLTLDTRDVMQISRDPRGNLRGTSALSAYATNVAAASHAEAFAADFYVHGGVPWAVLQPSKRLDGKQAADLQAQWMARTATRGAAPAVIPPDVTFHQFSFNPRDLMLIESREWDAKQIAAAFGVPAFMLNLPQAGGLNYSNPEMLFTTWWKSELYPTAHRLDQALSMWLPAGNWVEFDPGFLLRPDFATLVQTWLAMLAQGVVTQDEYRAAVLDLPPLSAGEATAMLDVPAGARGVPEVPTPTAAELEAMVS